MKTPIHATDEILIPVPKTDVWKVLAEVRNYPNWWPRSLHSRVVSGGDGPDPVGTEIELRPMGGRSFRCRVELVIPGERIRMRYSGGFIEGQGEWSIHSADSGTRVVYRLEVEAHGRLIAWIGRVMDLGRMHSRMMQEVLGNLQREVLGRGQGTGS